MFFKKGDTLGNMGCVGDATGTNLHIGARKMFEKLGYKQFIGDKEHYGIGEFISYKNYEHSRWINFNFYDKTIDCGMYDDPVEPMDITINELKAINQQCKELGWD